MKEVATNGGGPFGSLMPALYVMTICTVVAGCTGEVSGPLESIFEGADDASDYGNVLQFLNCDERPIGAQPLRRLSSTQYANTLRDLVGGDLGEYLANLNGGGGDVEPFPQTDPNGGFSGDDLANRVSSTEATQIENHVATLVEYLRSDFNTKYASVVNGTCEAIADPSDADIEDCIPAFVDGFGRRAFRRPVTHSESDRIRGIFNAASQTHGAREGFLAVLEYFLQSPPFLYRIEHGAASVPEAEHLRMLSDHELASRLSYLLWGTMPDVALLEAADRGELNTPGQIRAHAERMVNDFRFVETVAQMHREWLRVNEIADRNDGIPEGVRTSMLEQIDRLTEQVLDGSGTLEEFLTAETMPWDETLASYLGLPHSSNSWVAMQQENRLGVLTLPAVMVATAPPSHLAVALRGHFILSALLCKGISSPPGNLNISAPLEETAHLPTARQRLAPQVENPSCAGCHAVLNPLGLAFENFDSEGRWRDTENDAVIDASGEIIQADDASGVFADPSELVQRIGASAVARSCYNEHVLHFMLGRDVLGQDTCTVRELDGLTAQVGGNIRALFVEITQTDAFLYRSESDYLED